MANINKNNSIAQEIKELKTQFINCVNPYVKSHILNRLRVLRLYRDK